MEESGIFGVESEIYGGEQAFHGFKLLKTTANASLYLAYKAGKRFLIKTTKDNSERQLAMLRREYELSFGCDHPHIVHIYTIENLPIGVGLVMEYVEGRTLADYLAERPTLPERNRIFEELLSAVEYLHTRGVVHNDIKPENILISRADNTLKLIDFGLADSDAEYALRTLGCTPRYASPELRAQSGVMDARSDIYSIGVLMQDIFGNRHRRIVKRCCRESAAERYANISALHSSWRQRNRPLKVLLGVVATIVFVLPTLLYGQMKLAERNERIEREQLFRQIECEVERVYAIAADSISHEVYQEFAGVHLLSFIDEVTKFSNEHIATIEDVELNALANNVYMKAYTKSYKELYDRASSLPFTFQSNLPMEEVIFYNNLLKERKPYRPYRAK